MDAETCFNIFEYEMKKAINMTISLKLKSSKTKRGNKLVNWYAQALQSMKNTLGTLYSISRNGNENNKKKTFPRVQENIERKIWQVVNYKKPNQNYPEMNISSEISTNTIIPQKH